MFSTITSSVFSTVIIVYRDHDIHGIRSVCSNKNFTPVQYHRHFEMVRKLQKVRGFQLVLCADVWECVAACAVRELEQAVTKWGMGSDDFFPEPLVISRQRMSSPTSLEDFGAGGHLPFATL